MTGRKWEKELGDIVDAAKCQGWTLERTTRHLRLRPPDRDQRMVLTSHRSSDRFTRKYFLAEMRRSGLIWPPPAPAPEPMKTHRSQEAVAMFNNSNQEEPEVTAVAEVNGADVDAVYDGWQPIILPDIVPGTLINREGQIRTESGKVKSQRLVGRQMWTDLRGTDNRNKALRVDKLMLCTFIGKPPAIDIPIHINGDDQDCRLENLRWPEEGEEVSYPGRGGSRKKGQKVEVEVPVLRRKIEDLDLSVRTFNLLKREGIHTVLDLAERSPNELLSLPRFSTDTVDELEIKLQDLGLIMADNKPEEDLVEEIEAEEEDVLMRPAPPTPKPKKAKAKKVAPIGGAGDIEVLKTYRHKASKLSVTVDQNGKYTLPKLTGSPEQAEILGRIMLMIAEHNRFMGIG